MSVKYERLERLGKGSYGTVYRVKDRQTGTVVALKKYASLNDYNEGIPECTLREMSILRLANHPNIIQTIWFDLVDFKFVSMKEYQYTLNDYTKTIYGQVRTSTIRQISYQILRGVYYLHSNGIVHRDIKPQNIMINIEDDGKLDVVLIDVGMGRNLDIIDRHHPKTQQVCTLWYRSPDLLLGYRDYHFELDIWSVGCIVGEMIKKDVLFRSHGEIGQLYEIFKVLGTPDTDEWPGLSEYPLYKSHWPQWTNRFDKVFDNYDSNLTDLLKSMLTMNPQERIKIDQALEHEFFDDYFEHGNYHDLQSYITNYEDNIITSLPKKWHEVIARYKIPFLNTCLVDQKEITSRKRRILLNWLVEVMGEYKLGLNSYLRAQNIIDRYCSKKIVDQKDYQLVGIASLWIAEKIEVICPIGHRELLYISANIYTPQQLVDMEKSILSAIELDTMFPISTSFLSLYSGLVGLKEDQISEVKFLLLYTTYCLELFAYHPSIRCISASLIVANKQDIVDNDKDGYIIKGCIELMKNWLNIHKNKKGNKTKHTGLRSLEWTKSYIDKYL